MGHQPDMQGHAEGGGLWDISQTCRDMLREGGHYGTSARHAGRGVMLRAGSIPETRDTE